MTDLGYCRLCAEIKICSNLIVINKNEEDFSTNLYYKISQCFQIQILSDDNLPKTICLNCCTQTNNIYEFHQKVHKAQEFLRNIFNNNSTGFQYNFTQNSTDETKSTDVNHLNESTETPTNSELIPKVEITEGELDTNDSEFLVQNESDSSQLSDNKLLLKIENNRTRSKKNRKRDVSSRFSTRLEVWKDYTWQCIKCLDQFKSRDELIVHSQKIHGKPPEYKCPECSKCYTKYPLFSQHMRGHKNQDKFRCEICGKGFNVKSNLKRHLRIYHELEQLSKYVCTTCGKVFKWPKSFEYHTKYYHIPAEDKFKFECEICKKKVSSENSLAIHKKVHDGKKGNVVLEPLPRMFKKKGESQQQVKDCDFFLPVFLMSGNPQRANEAMQCINRGPGNAEMENGFFQTSKDYMCDQCGVSFRQKDSLKYHINNVHTEISKDNYLPCSLCPAKLKHKIQLRRHIRQVHCDKRFECETCGKKFYLLTKYTVHLRLHTGERPFECRYCNKRFRRKPALENHIRQHTGEKPYCCTDCKHDFTDFSNYIKHMRRKHGVTSFKNVKKMNT